MAKPFVWVALDALSTDQTATLRMARRLNEEVPGNWGFKVNGDWIYLRGFENKPLKLLPDRPIFIDLKQWFGARTMTEVLLMADDSGATATNIHALAGALNPSGDYPLRKGELAKSIDSFKRRQPGSAMRIYAVAILTHYGDAYVQRHFRRSLPEELTILAEDAALAGAHGIIMPGTQLAHADSLLCLDGMLKVIPGSRWESFADERHEHEIHPAAVRDRGDVELVCGSPITKSSDPVGQLKELLSLVA